MGQQEGWEGGRSGVPVNLMTSFWTIKCHPGRRFLFPVVIWIHGIGLAVTVGGNGKPCALGQLDVPECPGTDMPGLGLPGEAPGHPAMPESCRGQNSGSPRWGQSWPRAQGCPRESTTKHTGTSAQYLHAVQGTLPAKRDTSTGRGGEQRATGHRAAFLVSPKGPRFKHPLIA